MLPEPFTPQFLSQLETFRLRTRKEFLGSHPGSYSAPRRGTSLEFADYRKYSLGDDLRYVDWGIYARTDRLYIKLFHEEVDLFAYIFIDASASMAFPTVEEKFLPASHIAVALSYVVLANQDHVKLHLLQGSSGDKASPFYRGRRRIADCINFAGSLKPAGSLAMAQALADHLRQFRRPGRRYSSPISWFLPSRINKHSIFCAPSIWIFRSSKFCPAARWTPLFLAAVWL